MGKKEGEGNNDNTLDGLIKRPDPNSRRHVVDYETKGCYISEDVRTHSGECCVCMEEPLTTPLPQRNEYPCEE